MKNIIIIDTETTNSIEEPFCYDIGFAVVNEKGETLCTYSFVVAEIFLDKELMSIAYFADKIPSYWEEIGNGSRRLARFSTIAKTFRKVCREYDIESVSAHNCRFDRLSLNNTSRLLSGSKYRWFVPYGIKWIDTLALSRAVLGNNTEYINFCVENGYTYGNNRPRLTAEIIHRFLTNDLDFCEAHTGLEDVLIEKDILFYCVENGATL